MSHFEFAIPEQKDELIEAHAGQYHVENVSPPRILLSQLQDAARAYNSEGVEFILEHFDSYFSILVHGPKLEWNVINKGFDHIERAIKGLCNHLEPIFQEKEIEDDVRVKNLNIIKMTLYLFTNIMKTKDTKLAADNSTKLTLGNKKSKKASADDDLSNWNDTHKQAALVALHLLLQQPLSRLWDPPLAEDNFVSMVSEPCYKAIEDQIIKTKTVRETVFQILGVLIKRYNHGTSCIIKLVQILQMMEHAVSPVCAGVVQLTKDFGLGTFGPQMVREIAEALANNSDEGEGGAGGVNTEAAAARYCGAFLLELTKELPKEMTGAIATIQPYLETDESYTLRVSVLGMMCEALCSELRGEGLSEQQRAIRDDFLDDLQEHMLDVSAHVRSKVLQFWCRMQRENCVPVARQRLVLERTKERLKDKAALVRKAAIQLIKIFLEFNPFSAQLSLEILQEELENEQKILQDLQTRLNPGPDPELLQKWNEIEPVVIKMIHEKIEIMTQDEPDLSQASLDNIYESIRRHLNSMEYYKAYLVVKHAERQYPDAKLLRCDMEKSDQVEYFVALLRNIYIIPETNQTATQQCESELALYKRVEEKESIVAFLQESVHFSQMMTEAVPIINTLLLSKQSGDVSESIDFFTAASHFNIQSAKIGVASMLQLVYGPDLDKREAVEKAYHEMYLETEAKTDRARAFTVAKNLVGLAQHISRGNASALEVLIGKWVEKEDINPAVIQVFWEMFLKKLDETTDMESHAALALLVMIANAKPSVTLANLEVIQTHGLTGDYKTRTLCAELMIALAKKNKRYPADHSMFTSLYDSLVETFCDLNEFASFAAKTIEVVYALCDSPEVLSSKLIVVFNEKLNESFSKENDDEEMYSEEYLTRFLLLLGEVALRHLIYLDVSVYSELRRRNQVREDRKAEEKRKKKANAFATPGKGRADALRRQTLMNLSNASASARTKGNSSVNTTVTQEDEAGLEGAVADDADAEYVRSVCERDIVGSGTALHKYLPLVRYILNNPNKFSANVQCAAGLTLTRYMFVSSAICEESLQLMVTVLMKSRHVALRTNFTMAFSDLTLRFPNLTQPWTKHIYNILRDDELDVRQCAVKMLSFLVLHEMVRVKGQIADMALCCADPDPKVAVMTRLFFKQLSQKGNSLYNVMPDIISRLSDPELKVPEPQYRIIMKYITSLIQKDRQMEALVEKLCQRFKLSTEERQWRDLAYCLSLFSYNERSLKKLIENMDCYKDKLHSRGVMECFQTLMSNTNKMAKNEVKALVTELNDKIEECFSVKDGERQEEGGGDAVPRTPRPTPRKPRGRRQRRASSSSPDENEPPANDVNTPVRKSTRKARTAKFNKIAEQSDESEEEDTDKRQEEDVYVFKKPAVRRKGRKK